MNINIELERALRKQMSHHAIDLEPVEHETIVANGQYQPYWVNIEGKLHKANYIAFRNPLPTEEESLLCVYGFEDSKEQYTFISHPETSETLP